MGTWNFGIVGTGLIADFHAKAIQSLPDTKLVAISGRTMEKALKLADKYNCKAYDDYNEMMADTGIDIITIATASGFHLEPAVEAALRGKHVICEKPLEITLKRIDRMIEAHDEAGTHLGGIFNFRYNDSVKVLKEAIDKGRFGTITYAAVYVPWWRNESYYKDSWHGTLEMDGGGAMMNQSIHMIDMLQYLMGPLKSLQAYASALVHDIEAEDTANAVVKFKNKALGVIYGTTASWPGQFRRLEITGSKGTVIQVENSFKVWQFADETEEDREILKNYGEIEGGGGVSDPAAIQFEPHARNIAAFINSIENHQPFEIDGREARKSVEIVLAIYKSARKHKMYKFG
jgi:UDP-N-acetyl-2-amino-2-deoxyglucuronate dehydrogenase